VQEAALAAAWFARDARWTPVAIGDEPPGDTVERDLARLCASVATERHTPEVIPLVSAAYERVLARAS